MANRQNNHFFMSLLGIRITSILSISLVLFLVGLLCAIFLMSRTINIFVKENINFSIVLKNNLTDAEINAVFKQLKQRPYVKSCTYVSKENALEMLIEELGEDPKEFLGYNPLFASIEVNLHAQYATKETVSIIEKEIRGMTTTQDMLYRKDLIEIVNDNLGNLGMMLGGLLVMLLFISIVLVNNTIRLHIYSKRFLIHTMQLVGATHAFIRRPFVMSNVSNGLMASILAWGMLSGLTYYIFSKVGMLHSLLSVKDIIMVYISVILFGIIISSFSAHFAVNKYLRMRVDKLYYE